MTIYFDLSGFGKTTDSKLLERVDRRVAGYYLAVPIAGEDNCVTVATAYPDNAAALRVLERLLHAAVVPVSSPETDVREAIARIYPESAATPRAILAWCDDPAWLPAVNETAASFGRALGREVHTLDDATPLVEVIDAAGRGDYALLVVHPTDEAAIRWIVRQSAVSLLLVRGQYAPINHILVALRGFGSDHKTLESVLPLLAREQTGATVLPLSRSATSPLSDLLAVDAPIRRHLRDFLNELKRYDVDVDVRFSQGDPLTQIAAEVRDGRHDLLVIAAEAEGSFVGQALSQIECEGLWPGRPVLVVRPPVDPSALVDG
jgi:hypothetical protein